MKLTIDNHEHKYFVNEDGLEECTFCYLLRGTIEQNFKPKEQKRIIQLINMDDFEGLSFPSLDAKRAFMDKMFADKINELTLQIHDLVDIIKHGK